MAYTCTAILPYGYYIVQFCACVVVRVRVFLKAIYTSKLKILKIIMWNIGMA